MMQSDSHRAAYDEPEISPLELVTIVLRRRRIVIATAFVASLLSLANALGTPVEYTATASFLPRGGEQGATSGVSGLAQQFGLSLAASGGVERSPRFYQDLLTSREIMDGLIKSRFERSTPEGVTTVDLAEHFEIKAATEEEKTARVRRYLEGVVSVTVRRETGVVTLSVRTDQAELSGSIARRLLELVSAFDVETRQSEASAEREFAAERLGHLREELSTAEDSLKLFLDENRQFLNSPQLSFEHDRLMRRVDMRQELMTAMAQEHERARIDEVRNTPVITVIDQPVPPALHNPRRRVMKMTVGMALGLVAGIMMAFAREVSHRSKRANSPAYGEFAKAMRDVMAAPFGFRRSE